MEEIFLIALGLIIGSFLNVVIVRLPRGESVIRPGSRCPACQAPIPFYLNIPLLSFLMLRGKCSRCRAPISWQYPLVEAFTAFSFWLTWIRFGPDLYTALAILFICLLIALALIDLKHMILPDELTLGGATVFLAYSFFHPLISPLNAWLTAILAALLFTGLFFFYLKVRKIEGLGFGDIKMIFFLGAFLGYRQLIVAVFLSSLLGLLAGLYFIVFRKKTLRFALPFGTFLSLGSYLSLFWGEAFLRLLPTRM